MLSCAVLCRFGRKPLFLLCGTTMAIMQVLHPAALMLKSKSESIR